MNEARRKEILEAARRFAEEVVRPRAVELDQKPDPESCFSWEIVERGDAYGLRTLTLDPAYGGAGADTLTTAMVIEELARADVGVAVVFAQTLKIIQALQRAATPAQKARFLPRFREDPRFLLAIGITEPETSSNYIIPYDHPEAPFRTIATRARGGWILNGRKHFISNGNRAQLYMIFAQTRPGASLVEGSTCFLVEQGTPGFRIGRVHDKLGERFTNNAELIFEDCFIPDENVLGEVDGGFEVLARFFPASNAYAAATILGVAEEAYERALRWTRTRVQGGRPLIEHDLIAALLAEMKMKLDAARAYVYQAAWAADHPEAWEPTLAALPKVFASQVAWEVVTAAFELHGGYGFMKDMGTGMEKLLRDASTFLHSDGANRSLLLKAARFIQRGEPALVWKSYLQAAA